MTLVYFTLGLFAVLLLHLLLRQLNRISAGTRRYIRFGLYGLAALAVLVLLLRFGAHYLAAILSGIGGLAALAYRLRRVLPWLIWWRRRKAQQNSGNNNQPNAQQSMSIDEACQILGVNKHASKEEIKAAYHRMMKQCHPDKGGSEYLASQLNQAKDILLKHMH